MNRYWLRIFLIVLGLSSITATTVNAEEGVNDKEITIGSVLALEGNHSSVGKAMKLGLETAFRGVTIDNRRLRLLTANDDGDPTKTNAAVRELLDKKVFLFAGNTGTPSVATTLPLLQADSIPAVEFLSPTELLRHNQANVINYRPTYVQEIQSLAQEAIKQGVAPASICAYVQNDRYGLAGLQGLLDALKDQPEAGDSRAALEKILAQPNGETVQLNDLGPVGFYTRTTLNARAGYDSLRAWETLHNTHCKIVITVGAYEPITRFIGYAMLKSEPWLYAAVSTIGASDFLQLLQKFDIKERVLLTQVVPPLDGNLSISKQAKKALGRDANPISEEGYIIGKLVIHGLQQLSTQKLAINRANFMATFTGQSFDLDGLAIDFKQDNQGSDLVVVNGLMNDTWKPLTDSVWKDWLEHTLVTTD